MQERQTRRDFLRSIAGAGAGLFLGSYPILGYGSHDSRQNTETPYDVALPPREGSVEFKDYNYMRNHKWALKAFIKDALGGKIPLKKNPMFHVDAHHDVCYTLESFEMSKDIINLLQAPESYDKITGVVEEETRKIDAGNWVIRLFAAGLTDEVFWVRPGWDFRDRETPSVTYFTFDPRCGAPHIYMLQATRRKADVEGARKVLTVREISAEDIPKCTKGLESFLWDIDLDYFSCCGQGKPEWVDMREFERREKVETEYYRRKYGSRLDVRGNMMREPFIKVYRASPEEIEGEMSLIKDIEGALPKVPSSKAVAVSPDFLFADQQKYIINRFFS